MSKKRHNKNSDAGFVPIRRGIFKHISDGRMSGKEWMVYSILHLKADHETGVCYKISGPALGYLLGIKPHYINRLMRSLERKGYIKRISHRGQVVCYPVVINKFFTSNGILIDAHNTKSLKEIGWYVEQDCTLTVFQRSFKCTSNVLQMSCLQELKNITIIKENSSQPNSDLSGDHKVTKNHFDENSIEFHLSSLLLSEIQKRKPDYKKPNLQVWSKHIDRMIRIDKRNPDKIAEVIKWCQLDAPKGDSGFGWQDNILSTAKLREKFDKLELAMEKAGEQEYVKPLQYDSDGLTPRERLRIKLEKEKQHQREDTERQ